MHNHRDACVFFKKRLVKLILHNTYCAVIRFFVQKKYRKNHAASARYFNACVLRGAHMEKGEMFRICVWALAIAVIVHER
jgi:hypothetical protein